MIKVISSLMNSVSRLCRQAAGRMGPAVLLAVALSGALQVQGQVLPPSMAGANQVNKIGVFRPGQTGQQAAWIVNSNGDHQTWDPGMLFGVGGDTPVLGDWNNGGQLELGTFNSGIWYLDLNGNNAWDPGIDNHYSWGVPQDIPVVGDWDHTGKLRIGVVRCTPPAGYSDCQTAAQAQPPVLGALYWYVNLHTCTERNGYGCQWSGQFGADPEVLGTDYAIYQFGLQNDKPVVGDWDHTGKLRIGVYRNGQWIVDISGCNCYDGGTAGFYSFGLPADQPAVGRWTGGTDAADLNLGVLRAGQWIVDANGSRAYEGFGQGQDATYSFGLSGDIPVVGSWPPIGGAATITSPTPSSTLTGSTATFTRTSVSGATYYYLYVGTSFAYYDIFANYIGTTQVVNNIPTNSGTLYVRLWTYLNNNWLSVDYTYTEFCGSCVVPVSVSVTTSPGGLSLTVDGTPCTAPCSFAWIPGSSHTIA